MEKIKFYNRLNINGLIAKLPIIQGGMGVGISLENLAGTVAKEGGIGIISSVGIGMDNIKTEKDFLTENVKALSKKIKQAREMADGGIIGVNIMSVQSDFDVLAECAIKEKIDLIVSGAGLPFDLPKFKTAGSDTKLVPIVSSARAAKLIIRRWLKKYNYLPDALIVEGYKAGGHLGFKLEEIGKPEFALEKIFTDVLELVKPYEESHNRVIPVIPAGGIFTGADIYKFLKLGAAGVQMGTRFVTTEECDAHISFKNEYLKAKKEDIVIIKSPVGLPGRAIENQFIRDVKQGLKKPFKCAFHCIITCDYKNVPYCIANALVSSKKGILNNGFVFSGANAYRCNEIIPVHDLVQNIISEYETAVSEE